MVISARQLWQEVCVEKIGCSTSNPYDVRMRVVLSCKFSVFLGVDVFLKQILMNEISSKVECSQGA